MFSFVKKKEGQEVESLTAFLDGKVIPIAEVPGGREAPHRSKRGEGRREADALFCGRQAICPCGRKRVRGTEMAEQKEQTLEEIFGEMEGLLEALESREISLEDSFEKYK